MASLIVASLAMSSIEVSRWYARGLNQEAEYLQVVLALESASECAVAGLNSDENWRSNHVHDVDTPSLWLAGAETRFRLLDDDGDLNDDWDDEAEVIVTTQLEGVRKACRFSITPHGQPLACLAHTIATDKKLELKSNSVIASNGSVATDSHIDVNGGAYLAANCSTVGSVSGNVYGQLETIASLTIPKKEILDAYISRATHIDIEDLPEVDDDEFRIDGELLSASSNTMTGQLNSEGIYYINCQENELKIRNSRLRCTLVLDRLKDSSEIEGSVYWEAHTPNYPILLVDGEMRINMRRSPLRESDIGTNLNSPGTPFRNLVDSNTSSVYPSVLRGLIYVSKKLSFDDPFGETFVQGTIVVHDELITEGDLFLEYRDIFWQSPPPGFHTGSEVKIETGSFEMIEAP